MAGELAIAGALAAPRHDARGDAAIADDPDAGFTTWIDRPGGDRVGRSHLQLAGLWCAACGGLVEQTLLGEPGVSAARVSYATQRADVTWNPQLTRLSTLLAAVRQSGYGAAPDASAPARDLRRAEERSSLWRLFVALFCMMQVMMYQAPIYFAAPGTLTPDLRKLLLWAAWLLSLPVLLFSAGALFRDALSSLRRFRIGMDLPVCLGIAITFIVSSGAAFDPDGAFGRDAYFDSMTMFVSFVLAGRFLALKMRHRVAATLEAAIGRVAAIVRRIEADGSTSLIAAQGLRRGDRVRVLAGEAFPADGPLLEGETEADEALLTGESLPVAKKVGDEAIAGSINLVGAVIQRVDRIGAETRYEGIVALVRGVLTDRPAMLQAADRIAGPFLWSVLVLAAGAASAWSMIDPTRAVWVAVSVLIVTCPCALSLAAPAALLAAAGALARRGILVQRLDAIESLAGVDTICFDKTGTLTERQPAFDRIDLQAAARSAGLDASAAMALATSLAALSAHPLARALAAESRRAPATALFEWRDVREHAGLGIEAALADGRRYRLGAAAWASEGRIVASYRSGPQTWLGGPDGPLACIGFNETLRAEARTTVDALRDDGLRLALLSGDASRRVREVGDRLGIDQAQGDATPTDKLTTVALMQCAGQHVAMVGDGINDAPVMARADVSIAIGEGADLTRSRADIVLMSGSLADVAWARRIARRAVRIVRQNMAWALAYNATCVPLALLGLFPPWAAGLGMALSSLLVVLNAMRVDRASRPAPALSR